MTNTESQGAGEWEERYLNGESLGALLDQQARELSSLRETVGRLEKKAALADGLVRHLRSSQHSGELCVETEDFLDAVLALTSPEEVNPDA